MNLKRRAIISGLLLAPALPLPIFAQEVDNPLRNEGSWPDLRDDIVGDAEILDGHDQFQVDLPARAEDAAIVPIRIKQIGEKEISKLLIVIDENPAPVAATFDFSDAMQPLDFETRIRVDRYSNIRVIATIDDKLYMNGRFVKASGGCSAPASKDPEEAMRGLGQMRLRSFNDNTQQSRPMQEAQLQIRHPNYSGLQRDQITQLFVQAMFIDHLKIMQGDKMLFDMTGGISISEDPSFRFFYQDNGDTNIIVEASDTDGHMFRETFDKAAING